LLPASRSAHALLSHGTHLNVLHDQNRRCELAYFPLFLLWLTFEISGSDKPPESRLDTNPSSHQLVRDWTDSGGSRHARAVLLRVDGDNLQLKSADGRLVSAKLNELSPSDQQYVAANPPKKTSIKKLSPQDSVLGVLSRLPSLNQATAWLRPSGTDTPRRVVPAAIVYVRLSRDFLEDYVDRTVHDRQPVRDCILGTRIVGESNTSGEIHLLLRPMFGKLLGEIAFDGTVHSRTVGYNGPAIIHSVSDATFQARKPISLGPSGLNVGSATACAPTNLQTTDIETTLPRLRGRIATRIASRRNAASHEEAQAITSQHTATTIGNDLDKRIDQSVARIQKVLQIKVPGLEVDRNRATFVTRYRSTPNYVEMAMIRQGASPEELRLRPPPVDGEPDFAIRVNRALLGTTIGDSQLTQQLTPLLFKLLEARVMAKAIAAGKPVVGTPGNSTKWSLDQNWLVMDFADTGRQVLSPANESKKR
jgi:SLA1 homology domain 1, SHD1